ncbi:MAG TPA: hypothetical protein VK789_11495 [Bryobacteraceae bacterium]|nr:hypothetical protein [Bryobacteraceae bacterium]
MMHDPFQTYATLGAYSGIGNPFQNPFSSMQFNPTQAWNPLTAYQQQPGYGGINPQTAHLQNPLLQAGLQHNIGYNPILQQLAAYQLAQHIVAQQVAAQQVAAQQLAAQQGGLFPQVGQIGFGGQGQGLSPYGQFGSPFGQIGTQLAPQSWVGQAGQLGIGQNNPLLLAQLTARALQAQGINPGVGFQG